VVKLSYKYIRLVLRFLHSHAYKSSIDYLTSYHLVVGMARGDKKDNSISRNSEEFKAWVKWHPDVNICVLFYHGKGLNGFILPLFIIQFDRGNIFCRNHQCIFVMLSTIGSSYICSSFV
jgi:hypothetical protein